MISFITKTCDTFDGGRKVKLILQIGQFSTFCQFQLIYQPLHSFSIYKEGVRIHKRLNELERKYISVKNKGENFFLMIRDLGQDP